MKSLGSGAFFSQLNSSFFLVSFFGAAGFALLAGAGAVVSTLAFLAAGSCACQDIASRVRSKPTLPATCAHNFQHSHFKLATDVAPRTFAASGFDSRQPMFLGGSSSFCVKYQTAKPTPATARLASQSRMNTIGPPFLARQRKLQAGV